jgi:hypothetical protein
MQNSRTLVRPVGTGSLFYPVQLKITLPPSLFVSLATLDVSEVEPRHFSSTMSSSGRVGLGVGRGAGGALPISLHYNLKFILLFAFCYTVGLPT